MVTVFFFPFTHDFEKVRYLNLRGNGGEMKAAILLILAFSLNLTHSVGLEGRYKWKKRVLKCSKKSFTMQKSEMKENAPLFDDLKLIIINSDQLKKGCHLIGLDGSVKDRSSSWFKAHKLESIINQMPMRQEELQLK